MANILIQLNLKLVNQTKPLRNQLPKGEMKLLTELMVQSKYALIISVCLPRN